MNKDDQLVPELFDISNDAFDKGYDKGLEALAILKVDSTNLILDLQEEIKGFEACIACANKNSDAFTFFYFVGLRFAYDELLESINGA